MQFSEMVPVLETMIADYGTLGIFLAMLIETIFPPIPSEIVMPLAGFLAFEAGLGLVGLLKMILAGTAGATLGATIIYAVARYGGQPLVLKYGKKFLINEKKLNTAEKWFEKHGDYTVFLCRMAPALREIVSIPAGIAKMKFTKFLALTFFGSLAWTAFLGCIGYFFADTWRNFNLNMTFNLIAVVIVFGIIIFVIMRYFKNKNNSNMKQN